MYGGCLCLGVVCMCVYVCVWFSLFYVFCVCVVCEVTRLGEDMLATGWPTTCVKVLSLSFPMTNNADFLEAALTLTDIYPFFGIYFKVYSRQAMIRLKYCQKENSLQ